MPLETAALIHQLVPTNPPGSDRIFQGDDHIRMIKAALKATFPNIEGPVTVSHTAINALAAGMVPFGIISLWYGGVGTVPAGFAICDGATVARSDGSGTVVVPDLRGKVPIGASDAYPQGTSHGSPTQAPTTSASGTHEHNASLTFDGTHTHTGSTSSDVAGYVSTTTRNVDGSGNLPVSVVQSAVLLDGAHDHTVTVDGSGDHSHTATIGASGSHTHPIPAFSVIQPSYAMHYIMKI